MSSSKENWPKEGNDWNGGRFNSFLATSTSTSSRPHRFKYGGRPIKFDDLIYGSESLDEFCWQNNEKKTSLMIFSSSEDLTTSDSEICRYSKGRSRGIEGARIR